MITVSTILRDKKVTSRQIMKTCQVTQVTACSWIRGASVPHMKYMRDLAKVSRTHYTRMVSARMNSNNAPRTKKSGSRPKWTESRKAAARKVVNPVATESVTTDERRCHLMKVAAMFATLSNDEKVVVGMMSDALALLEEGGKDASSA